MRDETTKSTITDAEYMQITGLLAVAKREKELIDRIENSLREITGEPRDGHCMDAIYSDYDADTLLRKLKITVQAGAEPAATGASDSEKTE